MTASPICSQPFKNSQKRPTSLNVLSSDSDIVESPGKGRKPFDAFHQSAFVEVCMPCDEQTNDPTLIMLG